MSTFTMPGQLAFANGIAKPWRSIGAKAGVRYKVVPVQIAVPASLDDAQIIEAINFALTYIGDAGTPIVHDWQFLARDNAEGDNDHFREAVIDEDDLFADAPQAIFENWYLIPEGVECPQCNRFFTTPDDLAAIGDHALCTACLTAWRMTAAATNYDAVGDGYSEQPPFLPIPEWWAARGLEVPADDEAAAPKAPLTIDQVKDALPNVQVESRGKIFTAKLRGRRNPFAEVSWETDCGIMYAEFAWQTVTNAINSKKVLKA